MATAAQVTIGPAQLLELCNDAREESFFEDPSVQKLPKTAGYKHDPKDSMLEPSAKVRVYVSVGCRAQTNNFVNTAARRKNVTKLTHPMAHRLSPKSLITAQKSSPFEYPSEIKTAANHTIQLHGVIDATIGTVIALPPQINVFTFGTPTSWRFHSPCNFSRGGGGGAGPFFPTHPNNVNPQPNLKPHKLPPPH